MNYLPAITIGSRVTSQFRIVEGFPFEPDSFDQPHIWIAAQFNDAHIAGDPNGEACARSLGFPDEAIWLPGKEIPGSSILSRVVTLAVDQYKRHDLLPTAATHHIWGESVIFEGVTHDSGRGAYPDVVPHVDYNPPEVGHAALFASNRGGTVGWRGGRGYIYDGTLRTSYAAEVSESSMERVMAKPGEFIFTPDARTFIHARSPKVENTGRMLIRLLLGPEHNSR